MGGKGEGSCWLADLLADGYMSIQNFRSTVKKSSLQPFLGRRRKKGEDVNFTEERRKGSTKSEAPKGEDGRRKEMPQSQKPESDPPPPPQ
jgi:hypothetical protein